ncbi:galactose-3-O-sulfotransferase 2 isoform X2 [Brachyhypopomus gauderio]
MVLTILCVALQLLGTARQFRLIGQPSVKKQNEEVLGPVTAAFDPDQTDYHLFQLRNVKGKGLTSEQWWGEAIEPINKNLDTIPTGHLPSTGDGIIAQNGYNLATKPPLPRGVMEVDFQQPTTLNQKKHIPRTPIHDHPTEPFLLLNHNKSGTCYPKNHIVFLKTHKTASSTILNILFRYGDSRNLTFALPANMYSQLYYPNSFLSYFVEGVNPRRVTEFHIMCNHMRFQGLEVKKVMPVDTFYFSILRNPLSMIESLFTYYKEIQAFHRFKTVQDFLRDGGRSYNASFPSNHYARNILTFDFGLDNSAPADELELNKLSTSFIATVESNFHLILISEYFDESMVLLKHVLCWTLDDVVSFRLNSRSEKSRNKLSPEMAEKVKQWSSLDWRLYQHFNRTFWQHIDTTLGHTKLREELKLLRARRAELEQICLLGGGAVEPEQVHDSSVKPFQYGKAVIQGYNIRPGLKSNTHDLCQRMITPELQYTRAMYTKQFPDIAAKHKAKTAASRHYRVS